MFERFNVPARQVVVLAQEEAREMRHTSIGSEHILLGLVREEEGVAAGVLHALGVTLENLRARVERIVGSGEEKPSGRIPFTPRAKKVLELALREALSLGHNHIGTEHILLGLARENEGVGMRILLDQGIDSEKVRNEVIRVLSARRPSIEPHRAELRHPGERDDASAVFGTIERHIRGLLHREPDNGDLLVILASLPEGVVARAFADLGIDDAALNAALERARAAGPDAIEDQITLAAKRKDEALDARDFEAAARHRAEEIRLTEAGNIDLIGRVRRRLGLLPGEPN